MVLTGWQVASSPGCSAPNVASSHESGIPGSPFSPDRLEGSETPWVAYSSGSAALCLPSSWLPARAGSKTFSAKAKNEFCRFEGANVGRTLQGQASAVRGEGRRPAKGPQEQPSPITQSLFVCHWVALRSKQLGNNSFVTAQQPFVDLEPS